MEKEVDFLIKAVRSMIDCKPVPCKKTVISVIIYIRLREKCAQAVKWCKGDETFCDLSGFMGETIEITYDL